MFVILFIYLFVACLFVYWFPGLFCNCFLGFFSVSSFLCCLLLCRLLVSFLLSWFVRLFICLSSACLFIYWLISLFGLFTCSCFLCQYGLSSQNNVSFYSRDIWTIQVISQGDVILRCLYDFSGQDKDELTIEANQVSVSFPLASIICNSAFRCLRVGVKNQ